MATSWLKRSSLKRKTDKRSLLIGPATKPNMIMLFSMMVLFLTLGLFVMAKSYAAGTYLGGGY